MSFEPWLGTGKVFLPSENMTYEPFWRTTLYPIFISLFSISLYLKGILFYRGSQLISDDSLIVCLLKMVIHNHFNNIL